MRRIAAAAACVALSAAGAFAQEGTDSLAGQWRATLDLLNTGLARNGPDGIVARVDRMLAQHAADADPAAVAEITEAAEALRAAAAIESALPPYDPNASPEELVAALVDTRARWDLLREVITPIPGTRATRWDLECSGEEFPGVDPAMRVYRRGRTMIPALIDLLDDDTATRAVFPAPEPEIPVLLRRSDVAVALIQAISGCRFFGARQLKWFHQEPPDHRAMVKQNIVEWWSATKDLSPDEAVAWHLDRATDAARAEMLNALIALGKLEPVRRHLLGRFFASAEPDLDAAAQLADLGDFAALDRVSASVTPPGPLPPKLVSLLVSYGGEREYRLLHKLVMADLGGSGAGDGATVNAVVNALRATNNPLAVPILLSVVSASYERGDPAWVGPSRGRDQVILLAAQRAQEVVQRDFGFSMRQNVEDRAEAAQRMIAWWRSQGRGLYGFAVAELDRGGRIR